MAFNTKLAIFQVAIILICSIGVWQFSSSNQNSVDSESKFSVEDSNQVIHNFDNTPSRVAITNTYAATVMRMLNVDTSVIVGISGDFYDEDLWPEYTETPLIQQSAHSEIDFEALLDTRPEIYLVFATNGMVDTSAIRMKLEPVGIKVLALDFYKYDTLRYEINVLAKIFNKESEATKIFEEFDIIEEMVYERVSTISEDNIPRIVMEHHASLTRDPVVLTGTSQWTDMIEKAGGINVFANLPGHTTHVDMEAILDANPDILMFDGITFDIGFNAYDEAEKCDSHMGFISERPGFDNMQAITHDKMLILSGEFAGPMMIHGLPTLAKYLHPDLFLDVDSEKYLDDYFEKYHDIERKGKFLCTP